MADQPQNGREDLGIEVRRYQDRLGGDALPGRSIGGRVQ